MNGYDVSAAAYYDRLHAQEERILNIAFGLADDNTPEDQARHIARLRETVDNWRNIYNEAEKVSPTMPYEIANERTRRSAAK